MNLNNLIREKTRTINTRNWGCEIILEAPDGSALSTDAITGLQLRAIQIMFNSTKLDPDSGEDIIVPNPQISLSIDSLSVVPLPGENWFCVVLGTDIGIPRKRYKFSSDIFYREDTIGVIIVSLQEVVKKAP